MDCEHKLKVLEQEIESLKEENRTMDIRYVVPLST